MIVTCRYTRDHAQPSFEVWGFVSDYLRMHARPSSPIVMSFLMHLRTILSPSLGCTAISRLKPLASREWSNLQIGTRECFG